MLKVFIADDNHLIRQSLHKRIDWAALGMTCVGEAENGQQALGLICKLKPDIVIIDIRMPKLDGLQIIHHVREEQIPIQFIIISGYDDFAYLKQAIRLQAVNYILKPIHTPELIESLHQAAQRCTQSPAISMAKSHRVVPQDHTPPILSHMNTHHFANETSFPNFIFCISVNVPNGNQDKSLFSPECIDQIKKNVHSLLFPSPCHADLYANETLVLIIGQTSAQPISTYIFEQLKEKICAPIHAVPTYFACSDVKEQNFLPILFQQSITRLLNRFSPIFSDISKPCKQEQQIVFEQRQLRKKLEELIELKLYDSCIAVVKQYFSQSKSEGWYTICLTTVLRFWRDCLLNCDITPPFPADIPEAYALQFADTDTLENAILLSLKKLYLPNNQSTKYDKILRYINQFYAEPLTLQQLSQVFHLNQAYLGQLIKKASGLSFHTLLNRIRLDKAKEILQQNSTIPIKDLASALGFTDAYYFTRVFKQQFGTNPSEYRRMFEINHVHTTDKI